VLRESDKRLCSFTKKYFSEIFFSEKMFRDLTREAGQITRKGHPKRPSPEVCVPGVNKTAAEPEGKEIGCEPVRTDTFRSEKMTFFHDPDGLPIEIHE
jgi:catechol 2,3-dioxygenase-like lactoylglutathione lyase family enzyme